MKFILSLILLLTTSVFANISHQLKTQCFSNYNSNLFNYSGDKVNRYVYTLNINDDTLYKNIYEHQNDNKLYGKSKSILPLALKGYDYNYHFERNTSKFKPKFYLIDSNTLKKIEDNKYKGLWHKIKRLDKSNKNIEILFNDGIKNNLSLMVEYYEKGMIKVKEKNIGIGSWKNGKYVKPPKYVIKEYFNPKKVSKVYPLNLTLTEKQEAICEEQFQSDLTDDNIKKITELLLWIGGISLFLGILYLIYRGIKKSIKFAKEKKEQISKEMEDRKIRKIAEEESIRESVKKSMSKAEDDELEKLQELINNAVAKGDSETAQTLLELLKKKKEKK